MDVKPGEHDVSEATAVRRHLGVGLDVGHGPGPLVIVRLPLVHQLAEPGLLFVDRSGVREVRLGENTARKVAPTDYFSRCLS